MKYPIIIAIMLVSALLLTSCASSTGGSTPSSTGGSTTPSSTTVLPQVWELTAGAQGEQGGQVAKVTVSPFTNSGTFSETSDSPGWWMFGATGERLFRLPVGGNIVHTGAGDRWSFVGLGGAGGDYQTLGRGEGTANGQFPNATAVTGTITLTTTGPPSGLTGKRDTVSGDVSWSGVKIK